MDNLMDKVVGEMCLCGHEKTEHDGLIHSGPCKDCSCPRFTWVSFIFAEEDDDDDTS